MNWQFGGEAPIYAQLVSQIKQRVVTGEYPPGGRLPSVRDLAMEAGVNPNTMQRALAELEREGLVYSQRTAGRYVTEDIGMIEEAKLGLAQAQIRLFLEAMGRLGYTMDEILEMVSRKAKGEGA